ncbi:MAG: sulfotransferase [Myxococcota bacterium]|nr:sulfotransferase [Myxococcota bacterium]
MAMPLEHGSSAYPQPLPEPSSRRSVRGPDFFLVGAPKCGTTALDHYLRQHPEIHMARVKEAHHFGSDLTIDRRTQYDDVERYLELFDGATHERRVGESSVFYLYSHEAAREIFEFNPEARIIVMVRNPVDQMHSYHSERLFRCTEDIRDFEEALAAEPDRAEGRRLPENRGFVDGVLYRRLASYSAQIERYFRLFGRERVHVIVHDDMVADREVVWEGLCKFLDVDPTFRPDMKRVNTNKSVRSRKLRNLMRSEPLRRLTRALVPAGLRFRLLRGLKAMNRREEARVPMDPALRSRLQSEFELEVRRLSQLLDRDLMHWVRD